MKKLSLKKEDVKAEMLESAKAVFAAKAIVDTIKPVVVANQKAVLAEMNVGCDPMWADDHEGAILDPKDSYLMSDVDFEFYHDKVKELNDAAGFKVKNPELCPLLVAESVERDATHEMLKAFEPLAGIKYESLCGSLEWYKKATELYLGLAASLI